MKNSLETVIVSLILYCRASGKTQHLDREINNRMHSHTGTIQREHIEVKERLEKYKAGTLLKVSLILLVTAWSQAVRFQILKKKLKTERKVKNNSMKICSHHLTWGCPPGTWWRQQRHRSPPRPWTAHQASPAPSSPSTGNSDLAKERVKSPKFKALPFLSRTIHLPPNLLASSSHMGLIPGKSIKEQTNFELTHLKEVKVAVAGQFARFHLKMDVT